MENDNIMSNIISKVSISGIRGVEHRDVELSPLTLITGSNGSGKSTIPVAIDFALLGLIPGYKKTETFANATDMAMAATVCKGDHVITRTLEQGKKLQERIIVNNGTPADAKAAAPVLEAILGREPPVLNMPAFWSSTPAEKRRMLLRLVADAETQKALADAEAKARAKKNALADDKRGAAKAVESLQKSLAELEKPTGNLDALRAERKEIETDLEATRGRVSKGEANDKARAELSALIAAVPEAEQVVADLTKSKEEIDIGAAKLAKERSEIGERPTVPSQYNVSDEILEIVQKALTLLYQMDLGEHEENIALSNEALSVLGTLVPEPEADLTATKAIEDYDRKLDSLTKGLDAAKVTLNDIAKKMAAAQGRLESAKEAEKRIEGIGVGLDTNDKALQEGLEKRLSDIKVKITPLEEVEVLSREVEKARLTAEEAVAEEDKAKTELDACVFAQSKIVDDASDLLAKRSKEILPYGNLRLVDDGKDVTITWAKNENLSVQRTTLSGGEQALFDNATGHSLAPNALVVIEAAEIDDVNLPIVMEHIAESCGDTQVLMLTCHPIVGAIADGWTHIELSGEAA